MSLYDSLYYGVIRYGTYKLVQKMPGGEKLTGFTRILHRVKPDECMDEVWKLSMTVDP